MTAPKTTWKAPLTMGLLAFAAFFLEYFSILVLEHLLLGVDVWHYTPGQRSVHCLLMAGIWALVIAGLLLVARRRGLSLQAAAGQMTAKNRLAALLCLAGCKVLTLIDWHTLKVLGEARGKTAFAFCAQYLYYFSEVGLVLLIIAFGQKAAEALLQRESKVPFGGVFLALTWGAFHFVSRGVGLEWWNGFSCMIFSVLSGAMYLQGKRRPGLSYCLIAVGYLL